MLQGYYFGHRRTIKAQSWSTGPGNEPVPYCSLLEAGKAVSSSWTRLPTPLKVSYPAPLVNPSVFSRADLALLMTAKSIDYLYMTAPYRKNQADPLHSFGTPHPEYPETPDSRNHR